MRLHRYCESVLRLCAGAALLSSSACSLQDFETLQSDQNVAGSIGTDQGGSGGDGGTSGTGGTDSDAGLGGTAGNGGTGGTGGTDANGGTAGTDGNGGTGGGEELGNLLDSGDFESGHTGWTPFGTSALVDSTDVAHTGTRSLQSTNRTEAWQGPSCNLVGRITEGNTYQVDAWVRTEADSYTVSMVLKQVCVGATESYTPLTGALISGTEWTQLTGIFTAPECQATELTLYFEGPPPDTTFFIDDVVLQRLPE